MTDFVTRGNGILSSRLPPGFCLNCGHAEAAHGRGWCDHEVRDYGDMDCGCTRLRLCAACEGDPEAHGRHICGRGDLD